MNGQGNLVFGIRAGLNYSTFLGPETEEEKHKFESWFLQIVLKSIFESLCDVCDIPNKSLCGKWFAMSIVGSLLLSVPADYTGLKNRKGQKVGQFCFYFGK